MLYVAYGSNTNLEQMEYRTPNSMVVGIGKIIGWKLVFNIHANIVAGTSSDYVPVVVWDIDSRDWPKLDMYEGYPRYYVRKNVPVRMDDGKEVDAIAYVMADDVVGISPPMESYFDVCEYGYLENGLDTDVLYDALEYAVENETEYNQYTH